jgi:hypothetical protein
VLCISIRFTNGTDFSLPFVSEMFTEGADVSDVQRDVDVNYAEYLFRSQKLDAKILQARYEKEFRPNMVGDVNRTDTTLKLWIDIFTS